MERVLDFASFGRRFEGNVRRLSVLESSALNGNAGVFLAFCFVLFEPIEAWLLMLLLFVSFKLALILELVLC